MSRSVMTAISAAVIGAALLVALLPFYFESWAREVSYNRCLQLVQQGEVARGSLHRLRLLLVLDDQSRVSCGVPSRRDVARLFVSRGIPLMIGPSLPATYLLAGAALLLLILMASRLLEPLVARSAAPVEGRRGRGGRIRPTRPARRVTFRDVAGIPEVIEELKEIVLFLREPEKVSRLGGRIPKGVLLQGPPGTGKTLIGKAIAGEAQVPFFSLSGSDFVEMFVGVGASRVRELFAEAKRCAPCIVFIDEIDAIGRQRGAESLPGQEEREQTLNALLVEMDGFQSNDAVIVLGATNRPDVLDPALLRPGRFDRQITVPPPNAKGRYRILKLYASRIKMDPKVDLMEIARATPGFTGADLANLVNEAALLAARRGKEQVEASDFDAAKDKIMLGIEQKGLTLSEEERRVVAFHEAGHAVAAIHLPQCEPVSRISIIPRGMSLGVTQQITTHERKSYTRPYLEDRLAMLLAGRAAEELFADTTSTAAYDDLQRATEIATKMVVEFGMSRRLGLVAYGSEVNQFLGGGMKTRPMSPETAKLVDQEVKDILDRAYRRAKAILNRERAFCGKLAEILAIEETMDGEEIEIIRECAEKLRGQGSEVASIHDCASCPAARWCERAFQQPNGGP